MIGFVRVTSSGSFQSGFPKAVFLERRCTRGNTATRVAAFSPPIKCACSEDRDPLS